MEPKFSKRQAVVVIHGIGEQRPMETLRGFVDQVVTKTNATGQKYWNKPDRLSDSFELRRLTSPGDGKNWPHTDYFEYYWAANMRDTTVRDVATWLIRLLFTPGREIPARLKWVWVSTWGLAITAALLAIAAGLASANGRFEQFAQWSWLISALSLAGSAVINTVFIGFIGDAARYLSPMPGNIAQRQTIRSNGVALIRRLHECGKYGRVIVVGHSLGSVIAYDILRFIWDEFRDESPTSDSPERRACLGEMRALIKRGVEPKGPSAKEYARAQNEFAHAYQDLQRRFWRAERENGQAWLVTDLVTCGSPLAHASILLADSMADLERRKKERELPMCPPTVQGTEDAFVYQIPETDARGRSIGETSALHTSAVFAPVCWTNLYFENDFIGGPVVPVFGIGVRDVIVRPETEHQGTRRTLEYMKGLTPLSHNLYWSVPREVEGKPKPMRWNAVRRMRGAMSINRMDVVTFAEPPEPEAAGAED